MAYTLYTDKTEEFMCEIAIKNASMKNAFARMVVESDDLTLMFPGQLKDGKCIVPIRRLRNLLEENASGKMHLEVVVEDTYFKPWEDKFTVEEHTSVKVRVEEQRKPSKPIVEVRTMNDLKTNLSTPAQELVFVCEKVGITKENFGNKTSDFKQVIKEYFKASPEYIKNGKKYIQEVISAMK